jgi:NSS family neurotransmitter:Na+ symporter
MGAIRTDRQDRWTGRTGFTLATIGSAVGLGSIWKFPYEVGSNGGGAFVLLYLAGLVLIVVPLMLAEFALGRRGGGDPATALTAIATRCGASRLWGLVGVAGVITGFLILSYYAVIGGWTLAYVAQTVARGLPGVNAAAVQSHFDGFLAAPGRMLVFHAFFLAVTAVIVARGVTGGIEAASRVLMPLLAGLMVLLAVYGLLEGDAGRAADFLLRPDPAHFTARAALDALGLGFFSIGVGMGLMMTYAAYADAAIDLRKVAVVSVLGDTAVSLLAGLAVFPLVFANGLDPAGGPGLVFVTLPIAFARMPFGTAVAVAFFLLLFVAALASAISMLELTVAMATRRFGWGRGYASLGIAALCYVGGIGTVLSFSHWADWHPLAVLPGFEEATFFDLLDHATSNLLLPLTGFALAVFAGWIAPSEVLAGELGLGATGQRWTRWLLRYVVPSAIAVTAAAPLLSGAGPA